MSKRIVSINSAGIFLCEKDRQLEIWLNQERLSKIPIEDIGILNIENTAISLTGKILSSLVDHGAIVIVCDSFHLPSATLLPINGVSVHALRTRALASLSLPKKKKIWGVIIREKIKLQSEVIAEDLLSSGKLKRLSKEVNSGDQDNKEATAARLYWSVIFKGLENNFTRSGESHLNGYLNYGYSIVRSAIARSLVNYGLSPVFGVFHKSRDNPFALADDFFEIYRPFVDLWLRKGLQDKDEVTQSSFKKYMLKILTSQIKIDGKVRPFLGAIDDTIESFVRFIDTNKESILVPDICEFQVTD